MKSALIKALELGFVIAFSVGGFTFLGYFLDQYLNTSPIFTMIGVIFGVVNAFYYLYRWAKP